MGLKVGANIKGVYVTAGVEGGGCDGLLNQMGGEDPCGFFFFPSVLKSHVFDSKSIQLLSADETKQGSMVEDFVAVVRGGNSETIAALVSKKLPTPQLMRLWGEGVDFNPDFLHRTVTSPVLYFDSSCPRYCVFFFLFCFYASSRSSSEL